MKTNIEKTQKRKADIARMVGTKDYKNPMLERKNGKIVIDHKKTAHSFVKLIQISPLNQKLKDIMIMRIMGVAPRYQPLTLMQVAIYKGMREDEVERFEKEGLYLIAEHFKKCSIKDGTDNFNQNSREKRDLATSLTR